MTSWIHLSGSGLCKDNMNRALTVLALVLVFLAKIEAWHKPKFCHNQTCPKYKVIEKHKDFELRSYGRTEWLTTKLHGNSTKDHKDAEALLRNYIREENKKGYNVSFDSWPLLTVDSESAFSWFVPPGTEFHTVDPRVQRMVLYNDQYVRSFSGLPTAQNAEEAALKLKKDLEKSGKRVYYHYIVASYESFWSLSHYNEIWFSPN